MEDETGRHGIPAFSSLYLLKVLAETRSFTKTAQRLRLSKATISTRISELERELGLPLVRRTTRSVALTDAGSHLVSNISAGFTQIEDSIADIQDLAEAPRGLIRVTGPVAFSRQVLTPILPGFLTRYPRVKLELDLNDNLVNLTREGFDLAIRHVSVPPDNYVAWPICSVKPLLVASDTYLQEFGEPQHPLELQQHSCLTYLRDRSGVRWDFERTFKRRPPERVSVNVSGPLCVNNSEVLRQAALAHLGIALVSDFSITEEIKQGQLRPILSDWKPIGFFGEQVFAMRPWSPHVPKAVECFVDYLRKELGGQINRKISRH